MYSNNNKKEEEPKAFNSHQKNLWGHQIQHFQANNL